MIQWEGSIFGLRLSPSKKQREILTDGPWKTIWFLSRRYALTLLTKANWRKCDKRMPYPYTDTGIYNVEWALTFLSLAQGIRGYVLQVGAYWLLFSGCFIPLFVKDYFISVGERKFIIGSAIFSKPPAVGQCQCL